MHHAVDGLAEKPVMVAIDHGGASRLRRAAIVRLRPILIIGIVACVGLIPAALSHGIGSDSQRTFAQVVVGGLISRVALSIFLLPVVYRAFANGRTG